MKKSILVVVTLFISLNVTSQNSLAKIEYSYAEEAFTNENYKKALEHIEETKRLLGNTNDRIMYLEIRVLEKSFSIAKNTLEDYNIFKKLNDLTSSYISNFENNVPIDKLKFVYDIQKKYKNYGIEVDHLMEGMSNMDGKNYDDALSHFLTACEAGNPEACKNIANVYAIKKDFDNCKKFNDKAIVLGSINAKYNEGRALYYGINGYNEDKVKGFQLMEETYKSGFLFASGALGRHYISSDKEKAKSLLLISYNQVKNKGAAFYLYYYCDVRNGGRVYSDAFEYLNMELEKDPENRWFNYFKGYMLFQKDQNSEAIKYYKVACEYNHAFSCRVLGNLYIKKEPGYGIIRDKNKGKKYINKACSLDPKYCD